MHKKLFSNYLLGVKINFIKLSLVTFAVLSLSGCMGKEEQTIEAQTQPKPVQYNSVLQEQRLSFDGNTNPNAVCPQITSIAGQQYYRKTNRDKTSWQAGILTLHRQCELVGTSANFAIGLKGRVIRARGSASGAINTNLPLDVIVKKQNGEVLYKNTFSVNVSLAQGLASGDIIFTNSNLNFEVSPQETFQDATILVGFKK